MRIICEHISRNFISANKLEVLKDITIATEEHDFICILGPNGCGKTTLLKIMAGILKPSSGNILYTGERNSPYPVSLIFQEQGLFPWLNVIDNICFNLEMRGLSRKDRYMKAEEFVKKLGLDKFVNYYPHQLSTGMKQKVSLIRGLLMDSAALLIDEPVASLDVYSKLIVQQDIYKIWEEYKKTIIYVTHDIEEALQLAKHIWVMSSSPAKIIKKFDISPYGPVLSEKRIIDAEVLALKKQIIGILQQEAEKVPS